MASIKQGAWYVNIAKTTIHLIYGLRSIASCKVINYKGGVCVKFVEAVIDHYEWQQPMQTKLLQCWLHQT